MKFGARSPRDAIGDRFPLPVQAGLPVSRFAEKTGTNSLIVLCLMVAPLLVVVTVGLFLTL